MLEFVKTDASTNILCVSLYFNNLETKFDYFHNFQMANKRKYLISRGNDRPFLFKNKKEVERYLVDIFLKDNV